ncbi:MAG TPA: MarR family transcriptional regulator [Stellaceae bacterium]|jgi:DNA-binding MarR family transcriptional regulator|nr:MarR family transcriptional regulator [Stellaceae bacterium]
MTTQILSSDAKRTIKPSRIDLTAKLERATRAKGLPTHGLGKMLLQCRRAFSAELTARLAGHDLTVSQWAHLRTLQGRQGIAQVELSRQIGIEKASSTAVLDSLEGRGLIRRPRDSEDRRRVNVFLTPAGLALVQEIIPDMLDLNTLALAGLSRDEIAGFLKGLDTVTQNLRQAKADEDARDDPPTAKRSKRARAAAT